MGSLMSKKKDTVGQVYKIKLAGHLDESWTDWFHGMKFTYEQDTTTTIYGEITDQSALHGILKKIHDLNLTLLAISLEDKNIQSGNQEKPGGRNDKE